MSVRPPEHLGLLGLQALASELSRDPLSLLSDDLREFHPISGTAFAIFTDWLGLAAPIIDRLVLPHWS